MSLKRWSLLSFSIALIFFTLVVYIKRTMTSSDYYGYTDFYKFYESVLFYFSGQNIYSNVTVFSVKHGMASSQSVSANLNPPFFTLLLLPLHSFNYAHAFRIYSFVSMLFLVPSVYMVLQGFPRWHKNILPIMALFLVYSPTSETLAFGQVTELILGLLVGAWLLAREHHDGWAGVLIGLACSIKLFCGLFLVYFFLMKRYRCVWSALSVMMVVAVISGVVFGWSAYLKYHEALTHINWYAATWNDSFYGIFMKLFSNVEKNHAFFVAPYLVPVLTFFSSAVLVVALWRTWKRVDFDMGFSLVMVSMLLLSPLGWGYYFPLLLIPYLVIVDRGNTWVHLMACFILFISMQTGDLIRPLRLQALSQVFVQGGLGFVVLLGIVLLLFYVGARSRQMQQSSGPEISENLWTLIYVIIFIPSFVSLGCVIKGLYALHGL